MSHVKPNPDADPEAYILIAEDNSGDVSLIRLALEEQGVGLTLSVHPDGERAVQFINEVGAGRESCPALVILDLNLPKIDGREVLQCIRRSPTCAAVPVIVFSSSDSERDRQLSLSHGANLYVKKPSNLDEFLQVGKLLKRMLDERSGPPGDTSGSTPG